MDLQQWIADEEKPVKTVDRTDGQAVVADLGPGVDADVDVVDETAIVVIGDETVDIDLPAEPKGVFIRNGVLTIELEAER